MNDLEYLNQISAQNSQPAKTGFLDKKMKIILGALGGVILLVVILASVMGGSSDSKPTISSELTRLYTWSNELSKTVTNYNSYVHSSSLRSKGAQFSTHLTELSSITYSYLINTLGIEAKSIASTSEDAAIIKKLNSTLENARLNGVLDHRYAYEMEYQTRYLLNIEDSVLKKNTDSKLQAQLQSSQESLNLIRESFRNFSESD